MSMRSKNKTAADLMAELEGDPAFVAQRLAREDVLRRRAEELARAEAPVVQALAEVGVEVKSAWDLVNRAIRCYPEAVPVLLSHLERPYPDAIRDGIARALAVPEARSGWEVLTRLYQDEGSGRAKDGLAVAVAAAATDDTIGDLIALARNRTHGASRLLLLRALERSKDPRAGPTLMELGADPELHEEIEVILNRKRRSTR
jgi:hypothetical protein